MISSKLLKKEESLPVIVIRPSQRRISFELHELWECRDLLYLLIWRDIKVRYKQTIIGSAWAILQPFLTMVVFNVIFGRLMQVPTDGIPYPIFAYSALVPWTYFTHALTKSCHSIVDHTEIIQKVYFPRLLIPISSVLAAFVDFMISFVILLGMMFYFEISPTIAILLLPCFMLLSIATALGVGLWLASLNVQFRDVANTLPFLTQLWLFASPVAYSAQLIPEKWRVMYSLNPMTVVVEGFRWALLGTSHIIQRETLLISIFAIIGILLGGVYFFRKQEDTFADII